ncbi:hypothetical protein PROFUN_11515 [Planoprotostelium fungivorum]|uniref:Potassium transporter n=1 Tax=Planoprotostelium fungivorum TaxID=1890364 RepID=A0A2P6NA00_9EUKA|nr:hypothetical protein PROFUN_11515 [Planoprotostelium fungivorum]
MYGLHFTSNSTRYPPSSTLDLTPDRYFESYYVVRTLRDPPSRLRKRAYPTSLQQNSSREGNRAFPRKSNVSNEERRSLSKDLRGIQEVEQTDIPQGILPPDGLSHSSNIVLLTIRALGVIYGDIGTSVLYVLSTLFSNGQPAEDDVFGGLSLILWSLILLVTFKYVLFILTADNHGEGGTFALTGLLMRRSSTTPKWLVLPVLIFSIIGASFTIADGALTPAVSVLSAIEGIAVFADGVTEAIIPITLVILVIFFILQRFGTSKIGIAFGPIMLVWFATIATLGIYRIIGRPDIFKCFNPWYAIRSLFTNGWDGFAQLGTVFLAVTGLEALYADLGHFGRLPIRLSWLFVVMPCLMLNYLGQGALLLEHPDLYGNPFYYMAPSWFQWPLLVIATLATIIASQALVSGSFSLISAAIAMGFCPPLHIHHTSKRVLGQIYIAEINYLLLILTIAIVLGFKHSVNITQAYGVTVCTVMLLTSLAFILVMRYSWKFPLWRVLPFCFFLLLDGLFIVAVYTKVPNGGWVSLMIGAIISVLLLSWMAGQRSLHRWTQNIRVMDVKTLENLLNEPTTTRQIVRGEVAERLSAEARRSSGLMRSETVVDGRNETEMVVLQMDTPEVRRISLGSFPFQHINRVPGMGVFLATPNSKADIPLVLELLVERLPALPDVVVILKVETKKVPFVTSASRITVKPLARGVYSMTVRFGYSESKMNVMPVIHLAQASHGLPEAAPVTFFLDAFEIHVHLKKNIKSVLRWAPNTLFSLENRIFPGHRRNIHIPMDHSLEIKTAAHLE